MQICISCYVSLPLNTENGCEIPKPNPKSDALNLTYRKISSILNSLHHLKMKIHPNNNTNKRDEK